MGLWILSLVCISFFGGPLSYGFFFAVTLLPVVSFIYLGIVALSFNIYQNLESRNMVCDGMTDYYFVLQNDMPFTFPGVRVMLFPDFFTVEDVPKDTEYELLPKDKFMFRTRLSCKYRGEYEVGVKSVILTDFLHLFRIKYNLPSTIRAIVIPKVVEVSRLQSIERIMTPKARESLLGKEYPQAVVREYIPGDSMRLIHWKASAKTGQLKVRRYEGENKQGISMYFTGKRYSKEPKKYLPLENKVLETVLAVNSYFAHQEIGVNVDNTMMDGKAFGVVSDVAGFQNFYNRIAEYIFTMDYPEDEEFDRFCSAVLRQPPKVVFMVIHELKSEVLFRTNAMADLGVYVVIYLISDEEIKGLEGYCNERRQIIPIRCEQDLNTVL